MLVTLFTRVVLVEILPQLLISLPTYVVKCVTSKVNVPAAKLVFWHTSDGQEMNVPSSSKSTKGTGLTKLLFFRIIRPLVFMKVRLVLLRNTRFELRFRFVALILFALRRSIVGKKRTLVFSNMSVVFVIVLFTSLELWIEM